MKNLQDWIGRQEERQDKIRAEPLAALLATLDRCETALKDGDPLPLAWQWLYFQDIRARRDLGRDGHPQLGGFLPPVALPRRMWAGGALEVSQPLKVGECVTRRSTISAVAEKQGREGPLVFVTVQHSFRGDAGGALEERHDIVYRDLPRAAPATPAEAPPTAFDWQEVIEPNSTLLFRYSALTFNGHRIHYDLDFCRLEEGYPGLVVHGPLIATYLLDLPRRHLPQRRVTHFSFRALRPLFHNAPFTVKAAQQGNQLRLWAEGPDGGLSFTAEARLN